MANILNGIRNIFSYGEKRAASSFTLNQVDNWQSFFMAGAVTDSGINVTKETAMRLSVIAACLRIISESMASLPLKVYKPIATGKEVAKERPEHNLLHFAPNPLQTSFAWRQVCQVDLLTDGNCYSIIHRIGAKVVALERVDPGAVSIKLDGNKATYKIGERDYKHTDILHISGLGWDGVKGLSPIEYAKQAIGLGLANEKFNAEFFGRGMTQTGILSAEQQLTAEQHKQLHEQWHKDSGQKGAQRTKIVGGGLKYQALSSTMVDAENTATRRFQLEECGRIFGIPNHLLNNLENASFSNIEMQSSEFVMYCIRPWAVRWEMEINKKLFPDGDYFAEFSLDGLLRANAADRAQLYKTLFEIGAITQNQIAKLENLEGTPEGNRRFVSKDMIPTDLIDKIHLQNDNSTAA